MPKRHVPADSRSNPYRPQSHADERVFVGRKQVVAQLAADLDSGYSYGLIGKPGIGKTSLIFALERELTGVRAAKSMLTPIPVYLAIDKKRLRSTAGETLYSILLNFIHAIRTHTGLVYPSEDQSLIEHARSGRFEKPFRSILNWYYERSGRACRLILFLDDLHRASGCEWLIETMSVLRPVVSRGDNAVILLSGELPLEQELRNDVSPLRNLVTQQVTLGPLAQDEVTQLVHVARSSGWHVEPGCENVAYQITNGHPYQLHFYLFTALSQYKEINRAVLMTIQRDPKTRSFLDTVLKRQSLVSDKEAPRLPRLGGPKRSERPRSKLDASRFDVFLAHNSQDKVLVRAISNELKRRGLKPWLDREQVPPGRWFLDVIQLAIPNVKSAAIVLGPSGLGKWQAVELRSFFSQCVKKSIPVIPVLLPGLNELPDELIFLQGLVVVRFGNTVDDIEALDNLEWGITGENPRKL